MGRGRVGMADVVGKVGRYGDRRGKGRGTKAYLEQNPLLHIRQVEGRLKPCSGLASIC